MKGKLFLLCLISIFLLQEAQAQLFARKYLNKVLNDTSDISRPQFLVYPTLAYAPETSWEIGFSSLYVYYPKRDTTNRLSEINGFTFITLENQYGIWFDHAIYTDKNKWFFLGKIRLQSFPLKYHGIGMDSPSDYLALVDANQIWIKERVLREIRKNMYWGLEVEYNQLSQVDFRKAENAPEFDLPLGFEGSRNLGLGLGLVYDDRHNVLNVRDGHFAELALIRYFPALSTFNFNALLLDSRLFRPVGANNVLAFQLLGQFMAGDVPFNQLALMGGDSMMRGYYFGRFRDRNQIATQVEYRMLPLPLGFTNRLGATVFASTATVVPNFSQASIHKVVWAAGAGARFLLFPKKDIYTRLDVAFTREGTGFYLFIGEAF
ncbi:BamA/TamA family outer membrane protein [Mongoliitalea daihaiensis]|uniref:BamA/TamA family outer membrane protein n=1 Tax=Mongoliitalea daihaiensis TaxID=2782006 RepID=UPI001F4662AA|nr:BamA/TamA family outer membrane protein [Mongoliitalea daihaiensis]UJP65888.1 BamA/TamA family outer membrane protein [Mongoliitalea daihaiensis]